MDGNRNTESQKLMNDEIEKHSIIIHPDDTDRTVLEKISLNLNGKTEAIAKLRRGQSALMNEISKMPTVEQFATVKEMVESHDKRFREFDRILVQALKRLDEIWDEIKGMIKKAGKNAVILFLTTLFITIIWVVLAYWFPWLHLDKPSIS